MLPIAVIVVPMEDKGPDAANVWPKQVTTTRTTLVTCAHCDNCWSRLRHVLTSSLTISPATAFVCRLSHMPDHLDRP